MFFLMYFDEFHLMFNNALFNMEMGYFFSFAKPHPFQPLLLRTFSQYLIFILDYLHDIFLKENLNEKSNGNQIDNLNN